MRSRPHGAPDSPHLLAPRIKSRVYIAGAIEDQSFPDEMKVRLEDALTKAGVDHQIETYQARHGGVFRDTPVYDAAADEQHWHTLVALFDATLKTSALLTLTRGEPATATCSTRRISFVDRCPPKLARQRRA